MLSQCFIHHNFKSNYFYLDSGANFSSTFDSTIINKLTKCRRDEVITAMTNGGTATFEQRGKMKLLPGIMTYYNPRMVATIISLTDLNEMNRSFYGTTAVFEILSWLF